LGERGLEGEIVFFDEPFSFVSFFCIFSPLQKEFERKQAEMREQVNTYYYYYYYYYYFYYYYYYYYYYTIQ